MQNQINERNNTQLFKTIRATARFTGLSECSLRKMLSEGKLPGIYCGTRFMVDCERLISQIREG